MSRGFLKQIRHIVCGIPIIYVVLSDFLFRVPFEHCQLSDLL